MAGTMPTGGGRSRTIAAINVTPLVDVVLVLLVILMVASTYIVAQTLKVQLPRAHSTDGTAGTGPSFKGIYGHPAELEEGSPAMVEDNYIRESILDPQAKIVLGFQPVMPTFQGRLKDQEITAIIEYVKTVK